jgi:hypothetical protein
LNGCFRGLQRVKFIAVEAEVVFENVESFDKVLQAVIFLLDRLAGVFAFP